MLKYILVWCLKYRRKVLVGEIAEELRTLLYQKTQVLEGTMEAHEIMPDHVDLFVQSDPTEAPQRLANPFKGYPSPTLRSRLPSLWSRSYSVGTLGHGSEETVT